MGPHASAMITASCYAGPIWLLLVVVIELYVVAYGTASADADLCTLCPDLCTLRLWCFHL